MSVSVDTDRKLNKKIDELIRKYPNRELYVLGDEILELQECKKAKHLFNKVNTITKYESIIDKRGW